MNRTVGVTVGRADDGGEGGSGTSPIRPPARGSRTGACARASGAGLVAAQRARSASGSAPASARSAGPAHFSGSFTSRTWFDATFSSTWTVPLGQRTSSFVTVSSFPRPKWTRMSDAPP